jgi:hypothetical protein
MSLGIAEVHQQAIAEVLGNMPIKALDDLGTELLIGAHYLPEVFRIQLASEGSRVHEITEQHRELAPLGVRRRRSSGDGGGLMSGHGLGNQQEPWLGQRRGRRRGRRRLTDPDQDRARLVASELFRLDEFGLHVFEILVIQSKTAFERAI